MKGEMTKVGDDDSEFWDIGDRSPKPQRRKQLERGSSIFPSLSVYLSAQAETKKELIVDPLGSLTGPDLSLLTEGENEDEDYVPKDNIDDVQSEASTTLGESKSEDEQRSTPDLEVRNSPNSEVGSTTNLENANSTHHELGNSPDPELGNSPDPELGNSPDPELGNSPDPELGSSPDPELGYPLNPEVPESPNSESRTSLDLAEDENYPVPEEPQHSPDHDLEAMVQHHSLKTDDEPDTEDPLAEEESEILFFDNSEPKSLYQIRQMSLDLDKNGAPEKEVEPPLKSLKKQVSIVSKTSEQVAESQVSVNSLLCPPHKLLKYWLHRGRKLIVTADGKMAVDAFVRSYALARIVHGDKHWRTARCKVFLARSYFYLLRYSTQAISHASEACEMMCKDLPSSTYMNKKPQIHHTLAWAFLVQGEAKAAINQHQSALPYFTKAMLYCQKFGALVSCRKRLKPSMQIDHPLDFIIRIMQAHAQCLLSNNSLLKAREKLEEAIQLVQESPDEKLRDVLLGPLLKDLGDFLLRHPGKTREGILDGKGIEKDKDEGFECLKKALVIIQDNERPGNANECEIRFLIVNHQLKYQKIPIKEIYWELHKLKIWSNKIHGEAGMQTRAVQDCLIQVFLNEGLYKEATAELQSLLQVVRNYYGDYNVHVCSVLRRLSSAYLMQNDLPRALVMLDHCLVVESFLYGISSRRVQTLKMKIKDLLLQVPQSVKAKILKKHPELQQKPPFKSY